MPTQTYTNSQIHTFTHSHIHTPVHVEGRPKPVVNGGPEVDVTMAHELYDGLVEHKVGGEPGPTGSSVLGSEVVNKYDVPRLYVCICVCAHVCVCVCEL